MTPERWQKVREIFQSALERAPEERSAFLANACGGDEALRKEVESLIASREKDGSFDSPAYQASAELIVDEQAELKPDQTIGTYEIVSFISRGGMGEVYLAQDRRLSRKVALKILPASFTSDVDRLRRFEQEAHSASALNHPNIITIYEILKVDSTHMIATEFVEGETLRQRLSHTSLTLNQSLQIAIQIADALAAAHQAGIVHRDIKPENIMLRPDGYVKVLDFGLAKLAEQTSSAVAAEAPTRQVRTGSGMVLGTAGYMSPEQARGKVVDARSDVFSLGAVIYEMVTQQRPFGGETPSDTLAAILKTEPPPVSHLAPDTPGELTRIVTKALRKDREERYQVVKDLLLDLKSLKEEIEFQAKLDQSAVPGKSLEAAPAQSGTASAAAPRTDELKGAVTTISGALSVQIKRHRTGLVFTLIALILVGAGLFGLYRLLTRTHVTHFQSVKITRITNSGKAIDATISPDGKYIVYELSDAGKQSIWIRQVSTANDKQIVPPAPVGFFGVTISRDGNDLYYAVKANLDAGTLYRVPLLGGTPVKILEKIDGPISFSPDGKRFVLVRSNYPNQGESALVIANADGSGERTLAVRKHPEWFTPVFFTGPAWSPDGNLIAATVAGVGLNKVSVAGGYGSSRVIAFRVEGGKEQVLTPEPWAFTARVEWLPDMSGLLVIGGEKPQGAQVWFLSYPDGQRRPITNDLNTYRTLTLTGDASKMTTIQANGLINLWVVPEGDAIRAHQLPTGNVGFYSSTGNSVSWTPDGRLIFVSNEGGNADIWLSDADGSNRKQLTSNQQQNLCPVVSPDGRYVVFASNRNGRTHVWRMDIDGSNAKQLTNGVEDSFPAVSPDNNWVVYSSLGATKETSWKVPIDGGNAVELSSRVATSPIISPDGKFIAYLYPESPDPFAPPNRMAVMPFDGREPIKTFSFQVSGTIWTTAQWSADGRSILYLVNVGSVTNIWSQPIDGGDPKQVTDFKDSLMTGFAWSHDGKTLACSRGILMRDAVLISDLK
jgi:serine/threonine protein kinase